MQYRFASALALIASVSALQITSPGKGAEVDLSKGVTIEWNSVNTDPSTFSIDLVNMSVNPPVTVSVAKDIKTSDGSIDIGPVPNVEEGKAYQFNFISTDPQNTGILAQSQQFIVEGSDSDDTTTTSSSETHSETSTVTPTETPTETHSETATGTESAHTTEGPTSGESTPVPTHGSNSTAISTGTNPTPTGPPAPPENNGATTLSRFAAAGFVMMAVAALF